MTSIRFATKMSILAVLLVGLGGIPAFAQFLSGIEGTVHDSSGALVAGAKVTIMDVRIGATRITTTNEAGYFHVDSIGASTYTVRIEVAGFKGWEQKGLALQVGETRTLAPVLEVGEVSAEVTVNAAAATVDLVSAKTESVIPEVTLQETPLSGQNVYGLASLTPGMTGAATQSGADNYTNEYAININAAGLRQEQNGYEIDGAQTNTPSRGGGTSISPNPEIVQSMEIQTNDFDAQKGRDGGATVDVFTKSGSNQYHGTIDYWFTNNNLTARTHFQSSLPPSQRNEISGTMGGPLFKNKLFWFGAIDVLRSSVTTASSATVETQDLYNWVKTNLANIGGSANYALQALTEAPPLTYASASSAQTVAQIESTAFGGSCATCSELVAPPAGLPSTLDAIGTVDFTGVAPKNGYQWSFRIDDYVGKNDRVYVDAMRTWDYNFSNGPGVRAAQNANGTNHSDFVNLDWTHTFSARLLNDAGANMIRPYGQNGGNATFAIPSVTIGSGVSGFGGWGPGNFTQTTIAWRDVMTATVKTHTLKFGFEQDNIRENDSQQPGNDRPSYTFENLLDFVQEAAQSETATPITLVPGTSVNGFYTQAPYNRRYRELFTGIYAQDDWKLTPRFTLNAGLRFDMMTNMFSVLSPALSPLTLGTGSSFDAQIAGATVGLAKNDHVLNHSLWGLGPRVGFSWDVFGKGKSALRGGFGLYNDQPPYLHITDLTASNLPLTYQPSLNALSGNTITFQLCSPPAGFTIVCPVVPISTSSAVVNPTTGALTVNGVLDRASLGGYDPQYKMTQVMAWSMSWQQQLPQNLILEANYSASAAHHLPIYNQDLNRFAGDLIQNNGAFTRLNPNFGGIAYATSNGNSVGNYFSAVLTRSMSHGLAMSGIYTFGKTLDELSTSGSLDSGAITNTTQSGPIIENGNLPFQRGRADFDIRQEFTATGTWTVPSRYQNAVENNFLGGWEFGGAWIIDTGLPAWVTTNQSFSPICSSGTPTGGICPAGTTVVGNSGGNYNADGDSLGVPMTPRFGSHLGGLKKANFLNGVFPGGASAFSAPSLGQEGNLDRNTYDNLGYNNLNFTFGKFFSVPWFFAEKLKFEAKGELYNAFNRSNLDSLDVNMPDSTFGKATSQLPARSLQLQLRASF
jgi:Carboxypeptidase regulatory-like domain/TonB dependent receptor